MPIGISDLDRLREIVGNLTRRAPADVQADSWPTEYGLDSLSLLIFREQCERAFNISISDEHWADMSTLSDIAEYLESSREHGSLSQRKTLGTSNVSLTPQWATNSLVEHMEIGMPLTGINHLSESALLKYLGDLRWRHVARLTGVQSRDMTDVSGNRLYPTFFYVESAFPQDRPMACYGENDTFQMVDSVKRFGSSMLDGTSYLIPPSKQDSITHPLDGIADAVLLGIPAVRMSNIFVMQFNGAEWLKKGRPREGLIENIRELPTAPDSHTIVKQAETNGYIDVPGPEYIPLNDIPLEFEYHVQPDRDVNGAGLLYFANYPVFLDLGERNALNRAQPAWPDELINKRTIVNRKIAYLNNASWKDILRITTQVWVKPPSSDADLSIASVRIYSNQKIHRQSDGRLMCVSSANKLLYGVAAEELQWS